MDTQFRASKQNFILNLIDTYRILWKVYSIKVACKAWKGIVGCIAKSVFVNLFVSVYLLRNEFFSRMVLFFVFFFNFFFLISFIIYDILMPFRILSCFIVLECKNLFFTLSNSGYINPRYEAVDLRDGDKGTFLGNSVIRAVKNINEKISEALIGMDPTLQPQIDHAMIDLDKTEKKVVFLFSRVIKCN